MLIVSALMSPLIKPVSFITSRLKSQSSIRIEGEIIGNITVQKGEF
jgi:cytoskeletal protein CcmA (bactofilin family)